MLYVIDFSRVLSGCGWCVSLALALLISKRLSRIENLAYEELLMSIQKKSLLNSLNTTKKAIVASSTATPENPSVSAPVSARVRAQVRAQVKAQVKAQVRAQVRAQTRSH
jgi:hypothetical protein